VSEERRIVTVLFADVTGSTAMGEEMDPEEVRALLGRYYALAKEVVAEHGGTLEKFIGDAVMAVFGLPTAHGDDAERAVAAALALRDRVRGDARLGERLAVRFGVSTGEVVASSDASAGDFLVTGDAVNVAARIQQAAEPWQVLVTERTAHAAAAAFEFGPESTMEAKGKSAPLVVQEALHRRGKPVRLPARAPMLGRDADFEQLLLVARRVFGEKRPWLVSLIAPAGTGKTRLLEEFLDHLGRQPNPPRVATAQCLPYGQQLTYWPMRQVLFDLVGLGEDAPAEEIRAATRQWLRSMDVEDPDRVAELLAATVGAGAEEAPDRSYLFGAWRTAIEAASRRAPLLIVFEDLHWSSDSLLDLVEFLMQPRADAPVLMVALTRPELLDRRPGWGGGRRNHLALSLEPLEPQAISELVRHLLDTDSPEVVRVVTERSEGNPFYAGELVRALVEQGSLQKLPDTVQATVLARLDLLPPGEKRVLQVGSVFGRSFRPEGIAAIEPGLAEVQGLCESVTARDLVRPGDGDRCIFRHILIREVAYQTLPRSERMRLHAAAANWLESRSGGREVAVGEIIAFHYREAALLASAIDPASEQALELRRQAVRWLVMAADVAQAAAALPEAVRHLRAAVDLAEESATGMLHERIGECLGGDPGVVAFKLALQLYEKHGAPAEDRLRALAGLLIIVTRMQGSVAERMADSEMAALRAEGRRLVEQTGDRRVVARFLAADAFYPFWLQLSEVPPKEVVDQANADAQEALRTARELGDYNLASVALDALSGNATSQDDYSGTREFARQRLEFEDRLNLVERIDAHSMMAWMNSVLGDLQAAADSSARGMAVIQPGQVPASVLHLIAWRIYALYHLGRWDEALPLGLRSIQLWDEVGRFAAGYTLRGVVAAWIIARSRREPAAAELAAMIREVALKYEPDHPHHQLAALVDGDLAAGRRLVGNTSGSVKRRYSPEMREMVIGVLCDAGAPPPVDIIDGLLTDWPDVLPLVAQARRAKGLALGDPAELAEAESILVRLGEVPLLARVRAELGRLTGDAAKADAGLRVLDGLRDFDYLGRQARV
jgi:class 3 adenylate cyclase